MTRKKLLFLCQTLPFPPDGGVNIRAFHLLRVLAEAYEVTALCFYRKTTRRDARAVQESVDGLSSFAHVEAFPIPQEQSSARLVWDHLRSVGTSRVYTVYTHESPAFRSRLEAFLATNDFDLIHVDSLDLSTYLPVLSSAPVIVDHHNVESALLVRRAAVESSVLRRGYLRHQARLMEREERRWCERVAMNLVVSEEDRDRLLEIAPNASTTVVPNGVDTEVFQPDYRGRDGIVFVGGYTWFPNRDGMEDFAQRMLPLIRQRSEDVPVRWVGRAEPHIVRRYSDEFGIEMTGYVEDIRPYVQSAACFVVPLRVGGGTRLKILDAWAMGKAVVSTSVGAEGLATRDGENILIRDTAEGFADAVHRLLAEPELRERIGRQGRRTAEERYDWGVVGTDMLDRYDEITVRGGRPGSMEAS